MSLDRNGGYLMKKNIGRVMLYCLVLFAAISVAGFTLAGENLVPKVDNFIILVDQSGSMFQTSQGKATAKAEQARNILSAMNERIPALGFTGAVQTFPPDITLVGPKVYERDLFGNMIQGLPVEGEIYGNQTPLGQGILGLGHVLQDMTPGRTAVIIVSDGEENSGLDGIEAAKDIRGKYPNTCFHAVSLAESDEGRRTLREITQLGGCVYAEGSDLASDGMAMDGFVKDVFYDAEMIAKPLDSDGDSVVDGMDRCPNTPRGVKVDARGCPLDSDGDGVYDHLDRCANTPEGAKVDEWGCALQLKEVVSIELNLEFDVNRAEIKPIYDEHLKKVADFMKAYPHTQAVIEGHTDSSGTDEYNLKLSQKRAEAVMYYLVENFGISMDRVKAMGFGETDPIADNDTEVGRQRNRRVVATISPPF
jgi:OOP family OmpA-OmpF porin